MVDSADTVGYALVLFGCCDSIDSTKLLVSYILLIHFALIDPTVDSDNASNLQGDLERIKSVFKLGGNP